MFKKVILKWLSDAFLALGGGFFVIAVMDLLSAPVTPLIVAVAISFAVTSLILSLVLRMVTMIPKD